MSKLQFWYGTAFSVSLRVTRKMNYLMLTFLGLTMASNEPHIVSGKMIDMDTGKVVFVFPEKKILKDSKADFSDIWGKDQNTYENNNSQTSGVYSLDGAISKSEKETTSCSSTGSCDGSVSLDKSTNDNY